MLRNIRAVLFDLDGTLLDSAPDLAAAADKMRTDRRMSALPYEAYRPFAGAGARGMLHVAFGMKPDHPDFIAMREEFFSNYEATLTANTYAFDGVKELIAYLQKRQMLWGVVTNKMARFTDPLTASMPLFASARAIVSGDTTPHSKPHPAPLLEAARRLGMPAEWCLYVGDDERDIVAGRAAGMPTVAAAYGYLGDKTDIDKWQADFQVNTPHQLIELLQQI